MTPTSSSRSGRPSPELGEEPFFLGVLPSQIEPDSGWSGHEVVPLLRRRKALRAGRWSFEVVLAAIASVGHAYVIRPPAGGRRTSPPGAVRAGGAVLVAAIPQSGQCVGARAISTVCCRPAVTRSRTCGSHSTAPWSCAKRPRGGGREKANGAAARQARWSYSGSSGAMAGSRPCLSPHTTADRSWTRLKRAAGAGHRHAISCPLCLAGLASRGAAGTSSLRLRAGGVVPSPRRRSPRSPRPAQSPVRGRSTGSSGE